MTEINLKRNLSNGRNTKSVEGTCVSSLKSEFSPLGEEVQPFISLAYSTCSSVSWTKPLLVMEGGFVTMFPYLETHYFAL